MSGIFSIFLSSSYIDFIMGKTQIKVTFRKQWEIVLFVWGLADLTLWMLGKNKLLIAYIVSASQPACECLQRSPHSHLGTCYECTIVLSPFYSRSNSGTDRLSDLSPVTQFGGTGA